MKNNLKPSIVLDFDDTLVKSSERIIEILNKKYGLHKTISDSKDWNFRSIYSEMNDDKVDELFSSADFFKTLNWNDNALEFLKKFKNNYKYIICSKGTKQNLDYKLQWLKTQLKIFNIDFKFIGLIFGEDTTLNKSAVDFSNCLFCIDDNTYALESINTPIKFLLRNFTDTNWNQIPKNSENVYVVNTFKEIETICEFDLFLKKEGIKIGI